MYKLENDQAIKLEVSNCELVSAAGDCLVCEPDYVIDSSTQKCVTVPIDRQIENCESYSGTFTCEFCIKNHYMSEEGCKVVETLIANCELYQTPEICHKCRETYITGLNGGSCIATPSDLNCSQYSLVSCNKCEEGHINDLNHYFKTDFNFSTHDEIKSLATSITRDTGLVPQQTCKKITEPNCISLELITGKCSKCEDGYYLTDNKTCSSYPDEIILNCLIYISEKKCQACLENYYFKSGTCTAILGTDEISNCSKYDNTADSPYCLTCSSDYYVSSGTCTARTNTTDENMPNCLEKTLNQDTCNKCIEGFQLTGDKLSCLPFVDKCKEYWPSSVGQKLRCKTCESSYYLKENTVSEAINSSPTQCLPGELENCKEFKNNEPRKCETCENQYVLNDAGDECIQSKTIEDCVIYKTTTKDACEHCDKANSFNFQVKSSCIDLSSPIPNCITHTGTNNSPECDACELGYYLNNNRCTVIPKDHCLTYNSEGGMCTKCKDGYKLNHESSCVTDYLYILDNCKTINSATQLGLDMLDCEECAEHHIPFDFKNSHVCMNDEELVKGNMTKVDSCMKYDLGGGCKQCDQNSTKKYLHKPDGGTSSCVADCATVNTTGAYDRIKLVTDANKTKGRLTNVNVCIPNGDEAVHCLIHGPAINDADDNAGDGDGNSICLKCKPGAIDVVDFEEPKYSNINIAESDWTKLVPSVYAKYPQVNCINLTAGHNVNGVSQDPVNLPNNCDYYKLLDGNNYTCIRCKFGYTSVISANGHLNACVADDVCSAGRYYNVDPMVDMLFSCHTCATTDHIPIIGIKGTNYPTQFNPTPTSFTKYNLSGNGTFADAGGNAKNINCIANQPSSLGFTDDTKYGVVENCALAVLITDSNGDGKTANRFGTYCMACKPGYSKIVNTVHEFVVTECNEIENCKAGGNLLNTCSECIDNYILRFTDDSEEPFHCLLIPESQRPKMANCYMAEEIDNNSSGECIVCKKNYHLNKDGYCEQYSMFNCPVERFNFNEDYNESLWNWMLYLKSYDAGCSQCNEGFSAVELVTSKHICLKSTWLMSYTDSLNINDTDYIPYCKHYKATEISTHICLECDSGYVIKGTTNELVTGAACYSETNLKNCAIAGDWQTCLRCKDKTFGLKDNKCTIGEIENCKDYNFDDNSHQVECVVCQPGYYLSVNNNVCVKGKLTNCDHYRNDFDRKCLTCAADHILINMYDEYDYCYPKADSLRCETMTINKETSPPEINCTECKNTAKQVIHTRDGTFETTCMKFSVVGECTEYLVEEEFRDTNFQCTLCSGGFYLDELTNTCKSRDLSISRCLEYNPFQDKCKTCETNFFLTEHNTVCKAYPKGILNCEHYISDGVCNRCKPNHYLWNNRCNYVTNQKENCEYYDSSTICRSCVDGFILVDNGCHKSNAKGCLTNETIDACASCPPMHVLEKTENIVHCVRKEITNCAEIEIHSPYPCLVCLDGFYLEDGACESPEPINHCLKYFSKTQCSVCRQGYALSVDGLVCDNSPGVQHYLNSGCVEAYIEPQPICSRCTPGHYFVNGSCLGKCEQNTYEEGCYSCWPYDQSICLFCRPGYYMNKEGKCLVSGDLNGDGDKDKPNSVVRLFISITLFYFAVY